MAPRSLSPSLHGSGVPESTPTLFLVFLSDPDPVSKFSEKPDPESLLIFGNNRSLHGHFLGKTLVNFGWIDVDGSWHLNRSRILLFEKFPDLGPPQIQTFWNRSGVGVWKSYSGHFRSRHQIWVESHFSDSDSTPASGFKTTAHALTPKNFETSTSTSVNTAKTFK